MVTWGPRAPALTGWSTQTGQTGVLSDGCPLEPSLTITPSHSQLAPPPVRPPFPRPQKKTVFSPNQSYQSSPNFSRPNISQGKAGGLTVTPYVWKGVLGYKKVRVDEDFVFVGGKTGYSAPKREREVGDGGELDFPEYGAFSGVGAGGRKLKSTSRRIHQLDKGDREEAKGDLKPKPIDNIAAMRDLRAIRERVGRRRQLFDEMAWAAMVRKYR